MKIVIDIDDEDYMRIQDIPDVFNSLTSRTYSAIRNGKPLPEHHGDLKDVNDIWNNIPDVNVLTNHFTTYDIQHFIDDAPIIIEGK